jgi:hypothetical protein
MSRKHTHRHRQHAAQDCDCGRPIPDASTAHLCPTCIDRLEQLLRDLPDLIDHANLTITRQTSTGARNGPRSAATPLVWHDAASVALASLMTTLVSWARACLPGMEVLRDVLIDQRRTLDEQAGPRITAASDLDTPAYIQVLREILDGLRSVDVQIRHLDEQISYLTSPRWVITANHARLIDTLQRCTTDLTHRDDAPALLAALERHQRDLQIVIDTPPARLYLGPCRADPLRSGVPCPEEVYAPDHTEHGKGHTCDACRTVQCRTCGTEHDVEQRRVWLSEAMDDRLATAGDIARGLTGTTGHEASEVKALGIKSLSEIKDDEGAVMQMAANTESAYFERMEALRDGKIAPEW